MAVSIRITHNLTHVQRLFQEIRRLGGSPEPLLRDIAFYGESSTRARFRSQTGPDGQRWQPSLRARLNGGKTLTRDGHLGDSVSSYVNDKSAVWGVNRIYAAIHQFGGTIKPKAGSLLRFAIPGLGWRAVRQVEMPARPFLGLSDQDRQEILDLVGDHLRELMRRPALGGA